MDSNDLVYIDEYGLRGTNFYWVKHEAKGITKEEVMSVGVTSERVQLHKDIVQAVARIQEELKKHGFELYIKEGYRSKELYQLVYDKRCAKFGKEETDRLLNMKDMPHSTGKTLDATLWDPVEGKEVYLRNGDDGTDALFIDFYRNREDEEGKRYQYLQDLLINTFIDHGFKLGTKKEYFHFDFVE